MHAEIARELLRAGPGLPLTLNGVPYLDKPPLLYALLARRFPSRGRAKRPPAPSRPARRWWPSPPPRGWARASSAGGPA
jgi:hypothetical protein